MKKQEIQTIVNALIPKLYSFAYAMLPDDLQAEKLLMDAYAAFLVREKSFICNHKNDGSKKEVSFLKKYVLANMIADIYALGTKRHSHFKYLGKKDFGQFDSFFKLGSSQRAILFLKENLNYSVEGIQEILNLSRHQVIETLYNTTHHLVAADQESQNVR